MKTLLTLFMAVFCINCLAQKDSSSVRSKVALPLKDSIITYEGIVTLDNTYSSKLLYKATKKWFVTSFKSAKAVIQSDDPTNGLVLAKGIVIIPVSAYVIGAVAPECEFTIQIDIKDGRYRYRFFNIQASGEFLNSSVKADMSNTYSKYLHNEYKPHGLLGINKMYAKFNESFAALDLQLSNLVNFLKLTMADSKKDDF
jgi:hypothetical protein